MRGAGLRILALMALAAGAVAWRERVGQIGFALGLATAALYALVLQSALTTF